MRVGYAVAYGEALEGQHKALTEAGCQEIFIADHKQPSADWHRIVEQLRPGDALLVANSQILGLSPTELEQLIWNLGARQVALLSLEVARILETSIDTLYLWSAACSSPLRAGSLNDDEGDLHPSREESTDLRPISSSVETVEERWVHSDWMTWFS